MIRLHLLGFTPDLKGLVFSGRRGGRTGTYWVPVDDDFWKSLQQLEGTRAEREAADGKPKKRKPGRPRKLTPEELTLAEVRALLAGQGREEPKPAADPEPEPEEQPAAVARQESRLSLREVQQLLREGRSVKDVAALAGVDEAWVERFTGPVMHEVRGVVAMTQAAVQERARLGPSGLPVGEAVARNLQDRKATQQTLETLDEGWDARRTRSGQWRVRLRFTHRGKRRSAEWEFSKDTREVRPRNELARELGWWPSAQARQKGRTGAGEGESGPARKRATTKKRAAPKKKAAKKKTAAKKTAAKKKAAPKRKPAAKRKPKRRSGR